MDVSNRTRFPLAVKSSRNQKWFKEYAKAFLFYSPVGLLGLTSNLYASSSLDDLEFDDTWNEIPVVLTAVRLKQQQSDVPASVTILQGKMLQDMGIKDISEALRLVPGMMVGYDTDNKLEVVQYHGGPNSMPRNMQVLVDGRSVYMSTLSTVDWQSIPVVIDDIDRIEVVRGPNAASYGSNAYQAIVNILTVHPADRSGSEVKRIQGNNGVKENHFRQSGSFGYSDYRFSLVQKDDAGITFKDYDTSFTTTFFDSQLSHKLEDGSELALSGIYQVTDKPISAITLDDFDYEDREKELEHNEFGGQWEKAFSSKHKLKVSAFYSRADHKSEVFIENVANIVVDEQFAELYTLNPSFANRLLSAEEEELPGLFGEVMEFDDQEQQALALLMFERYGQGVDTFSGIIDNSITETRYDIEVQDTLVIGEHLTLVSGAGWRRDISESQAFFDGTVDNNTARIFSSADWDTLGDWKFHLGLMWEKETDLDPVFNPRAAIIYRLDPRQSLRAVYSKTTRSPDAFETDVYWSYQVEEIASDGDLYGDTYYQVATGSDDLTHEVIISRELGYYGLSDNGTWEWDVRLFHEEQSDVIDQSLTLDNFQSQNGINVFYRGAEFQASYRPSPKIQLRLTGVRIDGGSSDNEAVLLRVHAENSGSFSWIQYWPAGILTSLGYYTADSYNAKDDGSDRSLFERVDFRVAKTFRLSGTEISTSGTLQHDLEGDGLVFDDVKYDDQTRFFLSLGINF